MALKKKIICVLHFFLTLLIYIEFQNQIATFTSIVILNQISSFLPNPSSIQSFFSISKYDGYNLRIFEPHTVIEERILTKRRILVLIQSQPANPNNNTKLQKSRVQNKNKTDPKRDLKKNITNQNRTLYPSNDSTINPMSNNKSNQTSTNVTNDNITVKNLKNSVIQYDQTTQIYVKVKLGKNGNKSHNSKNSTNNTDTKSNNTIMTNSSSLSKEGKNATKHKKNKTKENSLCPNCTYFQAVFNQTLVNTSIANCTSLYSLMPQKCQNCSSEYFLSQDNENCFKLIQFCDTYNENGTCIHCELGNYLQTTNTCNTIPVLYCIQYTNQQCTKCLDGYQLMRKKKACKQIKQDKLTQFESPYFDPYDSRNRPGNWYDPPPQQNNYSPIQNLNQMQKKVNKKRPHQKFQIQLILSFLNILILIALF